MMDDAPLEFELHSYIDGALDDEAMARIERYLEAHPQAAAKVRDYLRQKADIRAYARTTTAEPSPTIDALEKQLVRKLKRDSLFRWPRIAVAALLITAGWMGHALYLPMAEGPGLAEEMVQAHMLALTTPSDAASVTPDRVADMFSRIGERPDVPDLESIGLTPVAAQIFPSEDGLMLHVAYRDSADQIVSLFVLHTDRPDEMQRHMLNRNGVTLVYWQHERSRYTLAGSVSDEELERIADLLAQST